MSKIAVITGGSQGLGQAIAENLANKNYTVILIARTQAKLDDAVRKIEKNGGTALSYAADIADYDAMRKVADKIKNKFNKIDFLINNAGIIHTKQLVNTMVDEIKYDLEVNLFGAILCSKLFVPIIKVKGKILFISSGFGLMGPAGYSIYAAAKAGVINFAEALKRELKNISVYVAVPSDIDSPGFRIEKNNMPKWMKVSKTRGKILPANVAAEKIIRKCTGNRFFIFSNLSVYFLYILTKILPLRIRNKIIDILFPKP